MIPFIHKPFAALAPTVGASPDELKLIFSFLLSYPLAGLLKRIPDSSPERKNFFAIAISVFYLVGLFDLWDGLFSILISAGGAYCIATFLRTSPYMPWIAFAFVMVDITGAQMVLLMKLSAFCWNVADGQLPEDQLSDLQKDKMLKQLPPVVDFAGYVLFFPALFAGPAFDYTDYKQWIDTSMFDFPAQADPAKKPPTRKKRKIPRSGTPATWKAAQGLLWIGLFVYLSGRYSRDRLISDTYMDNGFLHRVWILYMTSFTARTKYYGVWSLTEGACILAGLGYNGLDAVTGRVSWNRLQNIDPWGVETAQNARGFLGGWNMNTNNWLRNYVYLRVTPRGRKPGFRASLITFGTSALWHGFYPGYYLSFVLASLVQTAAKHIRRYIRPFFMDPLTGNPSSKKLYYDIATFFGTQITFAFVTAPFLILTFKECFQVWARVYFYALLWTGGILAFFASPGKLMLQKQLEIRLGRKRTQLARSVSTDSLTGSQPILGISKDPESDIDEVIKEIRAKVEAQKKRS